MMANDCYMNGIGDLCAKSALHISTFLRIIVYVMIRQISCSWDFASFDGPGIEREEITLQVQPIQFINRGDKIWPVQFPRK
jgi:hypothetical protein